MYRRDSMETLVGKTITGILVDTDGQGYLTFETDQGPQTFTVEGDCCSHSYFAEVLNVHNLLRGHPVTAVEEMELDQGEFRPMQNDSSKCTTIYGYRIRMGEDSGIVTFRNASNGYYGGWCEATSPRTEGLTRITADWMGD